MRVAIVHALVESLEPINEELKREWPTCERMHLVDDSLSADLAASPHGLDDAMHRRFLSLGSYAASTGVAGILFSCSAFGPCVEAVAERLRPLPVLKPNEGMIRDVVALGVRVGLVATFAPTLRSMMAEFPAGVAVTTALADGALAALRSGDGEGHDRLVADAAKRLVSAGCGAIALAQFSMARAAGEVSARTGRPTLTTVRSAVRELKRRVGAT